ncbi:hypothetical protein Taro_034181 [Colocasia esculenta]|uniref:Uncharacterized protein n=1 Tax=Colocasia esculenta TaxID=4460 RepID=A0A843W975_COLES|nr:hypothetical protein [Colocasia esculenta]
MPGLASGEGLQQCSPSVSTSNISLSSYSPPNLGSAARNTSPRRHHSSTWSTSLRPSPEAEISTGFLPQATSRRKAP